MLPRTGDFQRFSKSIEGENRAPWYAASNASMAYAGSWDKLARGFLTNSTVFSIGFPNQNGRGETRKTPNLKGFSYIYARIDLENPVYT